MTHILCMPVIFKCTTSALKAIQRFNKNRSCHHQDEYAMVGSFLVTLCGVGGVSNLIGRAEIQAEIQLVMNTRSRKRGDDVLKTNDLLV